MLCLTTTYSILFEESENSILDMTQWKGVMKERLCPSQACEVVAFTSLWDSTFLICNISIHTSQVLSSVNLRLFLLGLNETKMYQLGP